MPFRPIELPGNGILLYESKHRGHDAISEHHHRVHQLLYAIEGKGTIALDRVEYGMEADDAVFVAPYSNHSIHSDSSLTLLVLAFDADKLDAYVREEVLARHFRKSMRLKLHPFAAGEVRQLLRKMLFEASGYDALCAWAEKVYLCEVLMVLARLQQSPGPTDTNSLRAERIRNYIDKHFYEPLSAGDLAAKLNISVRYLDAIFKEQYRITPLQYLTEVRIERAKKLLIETDKDIASICFEIGYETISTFYRTFKNVVSVSPNKFRQIHRARMEEGR
jgi:AraC-like DNA-binding protein